MTVKEVAGHLAMSTNGVYRLIYTNRIPFHRIPGTRSLRFRQEEVDMWMMGEATQKGANNHAKESSAAPLAD